MANKTLLLGTAQWGWTVSRAAAFELLDTWLAAGHRHIDAATNYPINKDPADFRAAERILHEYVHAHGLRDLDLTMKIGSLNNMRSPEINLSPSFILMMGEEYRRLFGENLKTLMLHWDNRSETAPIRESLRALYLLAKEQALRPGLSGIKHPELYAEANREWNLAFDIQLKHNVLQSDLSRYQAFISTPPGTVPTQRFFAYGINAGGLKLDGPYPTGSTFLARGGNPAQATLVLERLQELIPKWNLAQVRPPVRTMNHLGLIFAGLNPDLNGIVLGFRNKAQLEETLDFWKNLEVFDYQDVFTALARMTGSQK